MKQDKKVYLHIKNLPPKGLLTTPAFCWMFLDYVAAPMWLMGGAMTLVGLITLSNLSKLFTHTAVEL